MTKPCRQAFTILWLLWLMAPAWAQLPAQSEVALSGRLAPPGTSLDETYHRLMKYPLFRLARDTFERELGIRISDDVLSWLGGDYHLAIVRSGEESPLSRYARRTQLRRDYDRVISEVGRVGNAVEDFKRENDKLPESLEVLEPDYLYSPVDAPEGVSFLYTVTPEGGFRIRTVFGQDAVVAQAGPPPVYEDGLIEPNYSSFEVGPLDLLLEVRLADPEAAKQGLGRLFGPTQDGFWHTNDADFGLLMTIRGKWLLVADSPEAMSAAARALSGPGLESVPEYVKARQSVLAHPDAFGFINFKDILAHWRADSPPPPVVEMVAAAPWLALATRYTAEEVDAEVLLGLDLPSEGPLSELESLHGQRHAFSLLETAPWDSANLVVVDGRKAYELIEIASHLDPMIGGMSSAVFEHAEQMAGFDLVEWLQSGAEVMVSYERIDLLAAGLATWFGRGQQSGFPVTLAARVPSGEARAAALDRLSGFFEDEPETYPLAGVTVNRSIGQDLAFCQAGENVFFSGGGTYRLLEQMLLTSSGKKTPVTGLDSFKAFQASASGTQLLLSHQKVDWIYSLIKGVALLLGSEFRPEAVELGRFRDHYMDLSIEPAGLRLRSNIYATEQSF
ncbi:MAG: hypothetical protein KC910_03060 [Candidatus Eremiobacteraeota bacterium]|nr:hypothetical protein [Candidatus Eremiobacteraeota bacterium]